MRCPKLPRCLPDGLVHKVGVAANVDLMTEPLGDASKRLCQEGFMYRCPQLTAIQQPLLPMLRQVLTNYLKLLSAESRHAGQHVDLGAFQKRIALLVAPLVAC